MFFPWSILKGLVSVFLLSCFLSIPSNSTPGIAPSKIKDPLPQSLQDRNNVILDGLFTGYHNEQIQLTVEGKLLSFPVSPDATIALAGKHTGRLLPLQQFPVSLPVQVVIDETGTIREMRNKLEIHPSIPGTTLNESGHFATLCPAENYFTLYHFPDGLFLYELSASPQKTPLFLSDEPLCAWNKAGTKLAYTTPEHIDILPVPALVDPQHRNKISKKISIPFYSDPDSLQNNHLSKTVRVVTDLEFSPDNDHLLVSYLEDYPDRGSEELFLAVFSQNGKKLAQKSCANLEACCWLSDESVLLMCGTGEKGTGKGFVWHWQTGEINQTPLQYHGSCDNLCYSPVNQTIAYTITTDFLGQLYLDKPETEPKRVTQHEIAPSQTIPFPIRHLQWSRDGCLFFWDELNNTITKVNDKGKPICKFNGYLPKSGVASRFLYFAEEPLNEPLPLYLSPHL